jgi:hypothetical protein
MIKILLGAIRASLAAKIAWEFRHPSEAPWWTTLPERYQAALFRRRSYKRDSPAWVAGVVETAQ